MIQTVYFNLSDGPWMAAEDTRDNIKGPWGVMAPIPTIPGDWVYIAYNIRNEHDAKLMAASLKMRDALMRACEENDYCYLCDHHPSSGHHKDCYFWAEVEA